MTDLLDKLQLLAEESTICNEIENWLDSLGEISTEHANFLLEVKYLGLTNPDFAEKILKCLEKLAYKFYQGQEIAEFFISLTNANILRSRAKYDEALRLYKEADRQIRFRLPMIAAQRIGFL